MLRSNLSPKKGSTTLTAKFLKLENRSFMKELEQSISCQQCFAQTPGKRHIVCLSHPAINLFRDSCDPNIAIHLKRQTLSLIALQPIKAGSGLFVSPLSYCKRAAKSVCFAKLFKTCADAIMLSMRTLRDTTLMRIRGNSLLPKCWNWSWCCRRLAVHSQAQICSCSGRLVDLE